jgi:hypothetical protein
VSRGSSWSFFCHSTSICVEGATRIRWLLIPRPQH